MSDNSIPQKQCSRCKQSFPATTEHFSLHKGKLYCHCRACLKLDKQESHERNREKDNARTKAWAEENREYRLEQGRQYYQENRNVIIKRVRDWEIANREYRNERQRTRYAEDPEYREKQLQWRKDNIVYARLYGKIKRMQRRKNQPTCTVEELQALYEQQDGRCGYCGIPVRIEVEDDAYIDHIVPLSKGGASTIDNLLFCCEQCSLSKRAMYLSEWQSVRGW